MSGVRLGRLAHLEEGGVRRFEVGGQAITVARLEGGRLCAFADACPHIGASLSLGELDASERTVTCSWHGSQFDLETGRPLVGPARRPLAVYPAHLEGESIVVEIERPGA